MGASIEKPCLQISARRNGTLDPSLTKHSKTKKYQTRSVRPLQPSGRVRVEVNVFHITAAMQLKRIIIFALERFGKCMLGFIRIDSMVEKHSRTGGPVWDTPKFPMWTCVWQDQNLGMLWTCMCRNVKPQVRRLLRNCARAGGRWQLTQQLLQRCLLQGISFWRWNLLHHVAPENTSHASHVS